MMNKEDEERLVSTVLNYLEKARKTNNVGQKNFEEALNKFLEDWEKEETLVTKPKDIMYSRTTHSWDFFCVGCEDCVKSPHYCLPAMPSSIGLSKRIDPLETKEDECIVALGPNDECISCKQCNFGYKYGAKLVGKVKNGWQCYKCLLYTNNKFITPSEQQPEKHEVIARSKSANKIYMKTKKE